MLAGVGDASTTSEDFRRALGRSGARLIGRRRERKALRALVDAVRAGKSRALVVSGEPGIGKTALLDWLVDETSGVRIVRATGVQAEMDLPFAALHQLLTPMLDRLDHLPAPQRDALRTFFGISPGKAPNRFFGGLAVLGLLADVAEDQPLICVIDDEQWLDRASAQVLAFVARRLERESVGLVFATRRPSRDLVDLPQLAVGGLEDEDARTLLDSLGTGPLDERIRDQVISETRGNPLALLELLRGMSPAKIAGGLGIRRGATPLSKKIEESFRRRIDVLPAERRRLLLLAAVEPVGDLTLLVRAATHLGIPCETVNAAVDTGLIEVRPHVRFRHPLVRSALMNSSSQQEIREAHRALAEATDPEQDPDRRAWHRALAATGPDEEVAEELERSADRALARGGLTATAAFLEHAAILTPDSARRAQRMLTAAGAKLDADAPDDALRLLRASEAGPADALRTAQAEHLRGRIALEEQRMPEAARILLGAAQRMEAVDPALTREIYLEALVASMLSAAVDGSNSFLAVARAAHNAPAVPEPRRAVDVLLDAWVARATKGYAVAGPMLAEALSMISDSDGDSGRLVSGRAATVLAMELWDAEASFTIAQRQARAARGTGAMGQLRVALNVLGLGQVLAGEFASAGELIAEYCIVTEATGNPYFPFPEMMLVAWRGQEARVGELAETSRRTALGRGTDAVMPYVGCMSAVLHNGRGRHAEALVAAREVFEHDLCGLGPFVVPELAEAAARTGDRGVVVDVLDWLCERTRAMPSEWSLGIEARLRAFLAHGSDAEGFYQESIERLGRTRVRVELARAHLLYGEWLRREKRRADAREQLSTAHDMLATMGADAYADRARRELLATGATARRRTDDTRKELTPQEAQIARLARAGLSNAEIGARLFISARTVQYHLRKVFMKLGISARGQLDAVLPDDGK
ncbi:ATP-binding protein [Streptomyces canus]|uniref:ATP-binding protein n=1 Tax=Streptomyces canus TaxID=58343 RepID=UPI0009A0CA7C|nr:LuxR family transcriptional regulator [Streptomyces canus]